MKWPHHRTGVCLVSRMFNIDHSTAPAGPLYPLAPSFSPVLQHPVHPSLPGPFPWEALRMEVSQCKEYEILGADPSFPMSSGHPPWCSGLGISPLWFSFLQPGTWETALDQPLVPCEEGRNNSPLPPPPSISCPLMEAALWSGVRGTESTSLKSGSQAELSMSPSWSHPHLRRSTTQMSKS